MTTLNKQANPLLFLILTIIAGIFVLAPQVDFQHFLATGDHGRELYGSKLVLEGKLPYRDFSTVFGPLMYYYFALFFKIFGVTIQSALLGYYVLIFLTGVAIYRCCAIFCHPLLSFLCALWYWSMRDIEFFHTYNHNGGLLLLILIIYFILKYIHQSEKKYITRGTICIALLLLVRLNLGIVCLFAFFTSALLKNYFYPDNDKPSQLKFYTYSALAALTFPALIYGYLIYSLEGHIIYQCFPYFSSHRTDAISSPGKNIFELFRHSFSMIRNNWSLQILSLLTLTCLIENISYWIKQKSFKDKTLLVFLALSLFCILALHEFIASGVYYRLHWAIAIFWILCTLFVGQTLNRRLSLPLQMFILLAILIIPLILTHQKHTSLANLKQHPNGEFFVTRHHIYTTQNIDWKSTVHKATEYLVQNTSENDYIFVLPFEPLYYFLSDRNSATRQLIFFEHKNILPVQEKKIINELEEKNVNWVLLSNRMATAELGMGIFGKTYCPLLAKYIFQNFEPVYGVGPWDAPSGWIENHAVKILKRK